MLRHPVMQGYTQFPEIFKDIIELEILTRTDDEPTFLFGHSMGALVAVRLFI
jgi:surfactin synthase thioesterase subunit